MPEIVPEGPRGKDGRAPDVLKHGDVWMPMKMYRESEEVDFAIVGTGAGGATLGAMLAEAGFSVVMFDAGPWFRPLDEFASDELEQTKLYWTDNRIVTGGHPLELGRRNSGKAVGGSTVHFMMVSLRFRPEWFKSRSELGYGADWPVDWREMWHYYDEAEDALKIAGPVKFPWGPPRGRYPYRPHEVNAAGLVLARGAEKLGIKWCPTPLATVSAPRGASPPCVYRGFCGIGCSTNAKQSALVVWIPRALVAGAEVRDLAMVGRIEMGSNGRVTGVHYQREGQWRFQKAKNVVVAGYAIETPRLLLNSACPQFPNGLANSNGLVGKYFMVQSNDAVWGLMDEEIRWYKGPPSMALTEHWNYTDEGKDFFGGYAYMSQGPLAVEWARALATGRGLWGYKLKDAMTNYIHQAGLKIVGEVLPREENRVELSDTVDEYGLRVAKVVFSYCENDERLRQHAIRFMRKSMEAVGAKDIWDSESTAHLGGTCRMGDKPATSVVDPNGRAWDIPNLWVCDGSLMPTVGGVNPSLTIQAMSLRIADRIRAMASRGELERPARQPVQNSTRRRKALNVLGAGA
jgi:choline dehydrogenase-like flavoprotein